MEKSFITSGPVLIEGIGDSFLRAPTAHSDETSHPDRLVRVIAARIHL